jgi:hypothetical protein
MGLSGQRYASAALYPQERTPGTHCTGDWVGLRAGLDTEARGKVFACAGDRNRAVQSVARDAIVTELPQLHSGNNWLQLIMI